MIHDMKVGNRIIKVLIDQNLVKMMEISDIPNVLHGLKFCRAHFEPLKPPNYSRAWL